MCALSELASIYIEFYRRKSCRAVWCREPETYMFDHFCRVCAVADRGADVPSLGTQEAVSHIGCKMIRFVKKRLLKNVEWFHLFENTCTDAKILNKEPRLTGRFGN